MEQSVLAIGNPFGFDSTLTSGIVSGMDRQIRSQAGSLISGAIQTDAAINPGNSGGPLLNARGELVGLNTAIFSNTGSSVGVGFAIPVDTVTRIVPQLIEFGRVVRPSLNITLAGDQIAQQLRVKGGALVQARAACVYLSTHVLSRNSYILHTCLCTTGAWCPTLAFNFSYIPSAA